jgi:hypothetical protein
MEAAITFGGNCGSISEEKKSMNEMFAYCGLSCQTCPIYLATRQENIEEQRRMRIEIVRLCKEHYEMDYELEDISDCDGCHTDGERLFSACWNCFIRKCAREKELETCAYCAEYACGKLEAFLRAEPAAKTRLDAIRLSILQTNEKNHFHPSGDTAIIGHET